MFLMRDAFFWRPCRRLQLFLGLLHDRQRLLKLHVLHLLLRFGVGLRQVAPRLPRDAPPDPLWPASSTASRSLA